MTDFKAKIYPLSYIFGFLNSEVLLFVIVFCFGIARACVSQVFQAQGPGPRQRADDTAATKCVSLAGGSLTVSQTSVAKCPSDCGSLGRAVPVLLHHAAQRLS